MKAKMTILIAVCLTSNLLLLSGCGTDPMARCRQMMGSNSEMMQQMMKDKNNMPMMGQMQMGQMKPEEMRQMMEKMGDNPMMTQCMNMMRMRAYPGSTASLLVMNGSLKLTDEQMNRLKAIEDKANAEASQVLTEEQLKIFDAVTKEWKPMSMMEGMQTMMPQMQKMMGGQIPCPCPMCQQMMQGK